MLTLTVVISHRIHTVTVEIRTADFPTTAPGIRAQDERPLCRSHQQQKVSLPDQSVSHAVKDGGPGWAGIGTGSRRSDCSRLDGFESGLNFTRTLITLRGFFGQTTLDNGPQARRHGRAERIRDFAQDGRTDLEAGASFKRQASRSRFVEHDSKRPQIATIVSCLSPQNFWRHVRQRAAYAGRILESGKRASRAVEYAAPHLFG